MVAVAFTGFVDADNVRMLKMRRGFGFAAEPQYFLFARELSRENHLQCDDTIQTDLPRAIDDSHAATPDFFEQFEIAEASRRTRFGDGSCFCKIARRFGQRAIQRALRTKSARPVFRQRNTALGASTRFPR